MNWQTVIDSLRDDCKRLEDALKTIPANAVASNATTGTALVVLKLLADALQMGMNNRHKDAASYLDGPYRTEGGGMMCGKCGSVLVYGGRCMTCGGDVIRCEVSR